MERGDFDPRKFKKHNKADRPFGPLSQPAPLPPVSLSSWSPSNGSARRKQFKFDLTADPSCNGSLVEPALAASPAALRVTRRGPAPLLCTWDEGRVAAQDLFSRCCVTSPNMTYVPQLPVERQVVETFSDGMWGLHEYSRWPQRFLPAMPHIACIPHAPSTPYDPDVLFITLSPSKDWLEDKSVGCEGIGYLREGVLVPLRVAASQALRRYDSALPSNPALSAHGKLLVMILKQAAERMEKIPSTARTAVAVGAHIQRICLELAGLQIYQQRVLPRMVSDGDYSFDVLPVLGAFTSDASTAQTLTRVGVPTWFIRPITRSLAVWEVVGSQTPQCLSKEKASTPAYQNIGVVAGVANLTGSWLSNMAVGISQAVCGSRLSRLSPGTPSAIIPASVPFESLPPAKFQRVPDKHGTSSHMVMPAHAPPDHMPPNINRKKKPRASHRTEQTFQGKSSQRTQPCSKHEALRNPTTPPPIQPIFPSRSYYSSPFYTLAPSWRDALESVSPVGPPPASSVYFYPPPFLLDTISTIACLPDGAPHPEASRVDEKVHRYLHNLVRIRSFCRIRLFSPMLSSHPMSIAEWRAALWGTYSQVPFTVPPVSNPSIRRAKRRIEERNDVGRLFARVGLIPTYKDDMVPSLESVPITLAKAATDIRVRGLLLWESHEINFRCELMALDTALLQREDWQEVDRWDREAAVSGVWGEPSSVVSVIPTPFPDIPHFQWSLPPDVRWKDCRVYLARFIAIMIRWPSAPQSLKDARNEEPNTWTSERYTALQRVAVRFYVQSFVSLFNRLPVPPIAYFTSRITFAPVD